MSTAVETAAAGESTTAPIRRSGSSRFTPRKIRGVIVTGITWVLVFLFFFPVLWMVFTSFKSEAAAAQFPPSFITQLSFDRYAAVFERGMGLYLANSAALAVGSTVVVMLLAIPAAYALSVRRVGRWRDLLFFFISTKFMPVAASIIPVFLLLRVLGLLDNLWALGVLYLGMNLPLAIWMMRSFFAEVPYAVVEAAQIDGASYSRELWRVSLPIVAPGAAAAALICFIFAWNEYFLVNLLTAVVARTTPPFLGSFVDGRGQFLAVLSAASTIAVLPVIIAGWVAQKRLVRGLAMGAVK
ncbi:carbohydrate ABC transporter permease [Microlunatus soli]|uniref:Sorbitol/mannitol transport system permease protein n=1 Tax=Microlunatus soli TaxID=630515 RepID=A0A1H1XYY6_9ACTN|nr:carbohydrate ABC transporter permease [Microlunatus soli]SDT14139.1 sorbitol/mannitol transport system permease protein [Microlunatus soli]